MSEEVAALVVRLDARTARLEQGMKRAQSVSDRSLTAIDRRVNRTNRNLSNMGGGLSNAARARIGNVGNQLQDVIVQAQMGTDAFRILGQQGPQIAGAFGPAGAAIGVVVAALAALAPLLLTTSNDAKTLEDSIKDLGDVQNDLTASHDLLKQSLDELRAKYGENVDIVNKLRVALASLQLDKARQEFAALALEAERTLSKITIQPLASTDIVDDRSRRDMIRFAKQLEQLAAWFGVTNQQAIELTGALRELQAAKTFEEKAEAIAKMGDLLDDFNVELEKVPPEIKAALLEATELSVKFLEAKTVADDLDASLAAGAETTGAFADRATVLAANLAEAARQARIAFDMASSAYSLRFSDEEKLMGLSVEYTGPKPKKPKAPRRRGGGGGGGGRGADTGERFLEKLRERSAALDREIQLIGRSADARARLEAQFEKERIVREILEETKKKGSQLTEQEIAEAELLAEVIERQVLAIHEQEQALDRAKEAADAAADMQRDLQDAIGAVADQIADAIINADDFGEALKRVGFELAKMVGQGLFGQGPLGGVFEKLGNAIFSAKGNVFQGGNVTPFARGGIVGGPTAFPMPNGIGIMGEAGPEAILPLKRGRGGRLGVEASGGSGPTIVQNNYFEGVNDATRATLQQMVAASEARIMRAVPGRTQQGFRTRPALKR